MLGDLTLKDNIKDVLKKGVWDKNPRPVWNDGEAAHSHFITHKVNEYDLSNGDFPITTIKPTAWKSAIGEILWIFQEESNDLNVLENRYGVKWWNDWDIGDGTIGERYGKTVENYNQMKQLLTNIEVNPYSRRHIIDLWQFEDLAKGGLKPCLVQYIFSVRDGYLDVLLVQRSSDLIAASNINGVGASALLMMVAAHTGYKPGKFTWMVSNMHIYDRHFKIAEDLLNRNPSLIKPKLILSNQDKKFHEFEVSDFDIVDYNPQKLGHKIEVAI